MPSPALPTTAENELHHKVQLGLVSALALQLADAGARVDAQETLARLVEFTRVHFGAEELLMKVHGYPHLAAHAAAHRRLLEDVEAIALPAGPGAADALRSRLDRLRDWIRDHVRATDAAWDRWCLEHGIELER
jgi:hemerythrin